MSLPAPNLDDRHFQDIVDEARRLIPRYCPRWTDHNLSDPGITLVELFAWMTDLTLYRLNQVPDRHYIKFLELIGVRRLPPRPARADVIFRLTAPQPEAVTIAEGTEMATQRTETQDAISFTSDRDLAILVPEMIYCLVGRSDEESPEPPQENSVFHDYQQALRNPDIDAPIFRNPPQLGDAFYLGFRENHAAH
ncbi:MAG: putative baseplate assembly protein, partial [Dehalococcoidales bacterium]|nr:putative baseplate assembly protein [Dehalococcoidales bacterium]